LINVINLNSHLNIPDWQDKKQIVKKSISSFNNLNINTMVIKYVKLA